MLHVAIVLGTRPEAIKLAPLILALRAQPSRFKTSVILSGQHAQLVGPIFEFFGIVADDNLNLMAPNQTLSSLTSKAVAQTTDLLNRLAPDWVVVQGDTTTAMACALSAFYAHIKVAHLEAGLRTNCISSPYPEEVNRRIISQLATLHWAPTTEARDALSREGQPIPPAELVVTGNTVIDALLQSIAKLRISPVEDRDFSDIKAFLNKSQDHRFVLVTGHRRENFGGPLEEICSALAATAQSDPKTVFAYPVHPNPNVLEPVHDFLGGISNLMLIPPKDYPRFLQLLDLCHLVVTDSGGVQEEAPALGKTVLVTRANTERPEGLATGLVKLVGSEKTNIESAIKDALADSRESSIKLKPAFPYGDGKAVERCIDSLWNYPQNQL